MLLFEGDAVEDRMWSSPKLMWNILDDPCRVRDVTSRDRHAIPSGCFLSPPASWEHYPTDIRRNH